MAKYAKNFNKNKRIELHDEAMEQVNGGITYPPVIPEEWQTDGGIDEITYPPVIPEEWQTE